MKSFLGNILITGLFLIFPALVNAATYYASPAGSGSTCSLSAPCSASSGISKSVAGDTLLLRGGTYNQIISLTKSGTASAPITIGAYPAETVVIDGNYSIPTGTDWDPLVNISGSYVIFRDIEVTRSDGEGINITGSGSQIVNVFSHHNHEAGAILQGDYSVADGCRIWYNAMHNENGVQSPQGYGWGSGISAARHPSYAAIKNTVSWNNWGEGISTFAADHTTLEGNISYDNWSVNMYIQNVQYALVQRNLIYRTPNNIFTNITYKGSETGLVEDNEGPDSSAGDSSNNVYVNNLAYGNKGNFVHWSDNPPMYNAIIANNTFVNATGRSNIEISGTSSNVQFRNNIVVQDDSLSITAMGGGITKSNNLWSRTPSSNASGTNDIIGNPLLTKTGSTSPGQLTGEWFKLQSNSPAINKAVALSQVTEDYFRYSRGSSPDIGAHEYNGGGPLPTPSGNPTPTPRPTPTVRPTPTPTASPKLGDANGDGLVNKADLVIWVGNYAKLLSGQSNADFNNNGKVNSLDFGIWFGNFGK